MILSKIVIVHLRSNQLISFFIKHKFDLKFKYDAYYDDNLICTTKNINVYNFNIFFKNLLGVLD